MEMEEKLYKERKKKLYKIGVDSIVTIEYRYYKTPNRGGKKIPYRALLIPL